MDAAAIAAEMNGETTEETSTDDTHANPNT